MARITVEDCLQKVNNRFILVHMADKRTRQLYKGAKPLTNARGNREIVMSLREIAAGNVELDDETESRLQSGGLLSAEDNE